MARARRFVDAQGGASAGRCGFPRQLRVEAWPQPRRRRRRHRRRPGRRAISFFQPTPTTSVSLGLRFTRNSVRRLQRQPVRRQLPGDARHAADARRTTTARRARCRSGSQFYGRTQTAAFVNSDGNITFEEADKSSTERNVARLLTGPPRVAPFLADLDPTAGSGRVFLNAAADRYTVTWCNVRGFDTTRTTTVQATLLPTARSR